MSVIFNEPGGGQTPSNPSQQNNVFQFVQLTAPTERSSGVALVDGDRWFKPTDNGESGTAGLWIWRVVQASPLIAYWVSAELISSTVLSSTSVTSASVATLATIAPPFSTKKLWMESAFWVTRFNGTTNNASNYWTLILRYGAGSSNDSGFSPAIQKNTSATTIGTIYSTFSTYLDIGQVIENVEGESLPNLGIRYLFFRLTKVGSPSDLQNHSLAIHFRKIHP